jgi:hypothetical protein
MLARAKVVGEASDRHATCKGGRRQETSRYPYVRRLKTRPSPRHSLDRINNDWSNGGISALGTHGRSSRAGNSQRNVQRQRVVKLRGREHGDEKDNYRDRGGGAGV